MFSVCRTKKGDEYLNSVFLNTIAPYCKIGDYIFKVVFDIENDGFIKMGDNFRSILKVCINDNVSVTPFYEINQTFLSKCVFKYEFLGNTNGNIKNVNFINLLNNIPINKNCGYLYKDNNIKIRFICLSKAGSLFFRHTKPSDASRVNQYGNFS